MTRTDWPLGPALRKARERAGISVRAAARRTDGAISSGRWYQLESGYQKVGGQSLPIGTTASTVAAAARAVDWDITEALTVAGFDVRDYQPTTQEAEPIRRYTDDELVAEILRRMKGQGHDVDSTETTRASGKTIQDEEAKLSGDAEREDVALTVDEVAPAVEDVGVDSQDGQAFGQ